MTYDILSPAVAECVRSRRFGARAAVAPVLIAVLLTTAGCSRRGSRNAAAETDKVVNIAVTKVVRGDLSQGLRIAAEFRPF
jgi:hypothetical protein